MGACVIKRIKPRWTLLQAFPGKHYSFRLPQELDTDVNIFEYSSWLEDTEMLQSLRDAGEAQLVEHQPSKLNVASSTLVSRSTFLPI